MSSEQEFSYIWAGDQELAQAILQYLAKDSHIPLVQGFELRAIEIIPKGEWEKKYFLRDYPGGKWEVQIDSRARQYTRSYEEVCHAVRDFASGWRAYKKIIDASSSTKQQKLTSKV